MNTPFVFFFAVNTLKDTSGFFNMVLLIYGVWLPPLCQKPHKYCQIADIRQHITPHMFRHSFATLLLEENVDIRYIQSMLGHSSINVTEIYTHVTMSKQKDILKSKHPRKDMNISNQL